MIGYERTRGSGSLSNLFFLRGVVSRRQIVEVSSI
jgi:hypothetical protein